MNTTIQTCVNFIDDRLVFPLFFPCSVSFSLSFAGISIVLNLTPNYEKPSVWFKNVTAFAEKIRVSADKTEEIVKEVLFMWTENTIR